MEDNPPADVSIWLACVFCLKHQWYGDDNDVDDDGVAVVVVVVWF